MRNILSVTFIGGVTAATASLACGSGVVDPTPYHQAHEEHPGDFAAPSESNQDVPPDHVPANNRIPSGASGNDFSGCGLACGGTFTCDGAVNGHTSGGKLTIAAEHDGGCAADRGGVNETLIFSCDGKVLSDGTPVGMWSASISTTTFEMTLGSLSFRYICTKR